MKKFQRLFHQSQKKVEKLSEQAFLPKYLPITIGVTVLLLGFYGIIFFQWMNGFSDPMRGKGATLEVQPTTAPDATQQELVFSTNVDKIQQRNITGIQFVATIEGDVPENMVFVPAEIDGLQPLMTTITQEGSETVLKVVFLTVPPNDYVINSSTITLGTLQFSSPDNGRVKIKFDPYFAKIVDINTRKNILATPKPVTYTY